MTKAKCFRCGASATADTYEQARKQLDHSISLSRGIKCGDSYGKVQEIKDTTKQKTKQSTTKTETKIAEPQTEDTNPEAPIKSEKKVKEKKTKSKKE